MAIAIIHEDCKWKWGTKCTICKSHVSEIGPDPTYGGLCPGCLAADRGRLQAIVAKLPTLAGGTCWIPVRDRGLYHPGGFAFLPAGDTITWDGYRWLASIPDGDFGWNLQPVSECYRTEAEARAAAVAG